MNMRLGCILILLLCLMMSNSFSQTEEGLQTDYIMGGGEALLLDDATWHFDLGNYMRALYLFESLDKKYPGSNSYKYYRGRCCIEIPNEQKKAIEFLEAAFSNDPNLDDILFYLGKAYKVTYFFNEAIGYFKLANEKKLTSEDNRNLIPNLIAQCNHAKELIADTSKIKLMLKNIGAPINTEEDEYVPLVPSDESMLIYTYKGKKSTGGLQNIYGEPDPDGAYYEDIYISSKNEGDWQKPTDLSTKTNSKYHDAAITISPSGKTLFMYKDTRGGDIYVTKKTKNTWSKPKALQGDVNTKHFEGHASISLDGKSLYFISNRPGGIGGTDIYKAILQGNGTWGEVVNLGPTINSVYDEDAPFIHVSNRLLYFSSKGHKNMGGYDIFYSTLEQDGWKAPVNLGPPVNTTNDDNFYVVSANGERAYFSSIREGGFGGQDIYIVEPGIIEEKPKLALLKGTTMKNGKPVEAQINVINIITNELFGSFQSDPESGKYIISVPSGANYKLDFKYTNIKTRDTTLYMEDIAHSEIIDLEDLKYFVEVEQDFELSDKNNQDLDSINTLQKQINQKEVEAAVEAKDIIFLKSLTAPREYGVSITEDGYYFHSEKIDLPESFAYYDSIEFAVAETLTEPEIIPEADTISEPMMDTISEAEADTITAIVMDTISEVVPDTITEIVMDTISEAVPDTITETVIETISEAEPDPVIEKESEPEPVPVVETEPEPSQNPDNIEGEISLDNTKPKLDSGNKFEDILFDFDKHNLRTKSRQELEKLHDFMQDNSNIKLEIAGHTDAIGTKKYNQKLSERRANAAASYLVEKGLPKNRLQLYAFGKEKPIAQNTNSDGSDNPTGRQKNRRVEFSTKGDFSSANPENLVSFSRILSSNKDESRYSSDGKTFYKVQIAAYKYPENYNGAKLEDLGELDNLFVDGITRFTIGRFSDIKEARKLKRIIVKRGVADAFITAEVDGDRKYLNELNVQQMELSQVLPFGNIDANKKILKKYRNESARGLKFNVKIATNSNDIKEANISSNLGHKPICFTIASFNTLREAEEFRIKARETGARNPFVIATHNGQQVMQEDLINNNFYTL